MLNSAIQLDLSFKFSRMNLLDKVFVASKISLTYIKSLFSSPDPKGHVSYCHHLASVVVVRRKLFQKSSPLKVQDKWKPNCLNHH